MLSQIELLEQWNNQTKQHTHFLREKSKSLLIKQQLKRLGEILQIPPNAIDWKRAY